MSKLQTAHEELKLSRNKSDNLKIAAIENYLVAMTETLGVKESDLTSQNSAGGISFSGSNDLRQKLTKLAINGGSATTVSLESSGNSLLNSTFLITDLIEEVTPMLQSDVFNRFVPEQEFPTFKIGLDVAENISGMTFNTPMDAPVPIIKKRSITTTEITPKYNQEAVVFNQQEVLTLRKPGQTNLSLTGIATFVNMASNQLGHRGNVRIMNDTYEAIFTGELKWGSEVINYGVPPANRFKAVDLGSPWGTISPNGYVPNAAADPILQLSYVINDVLNRYRGLNLSIVMNPNTNQLFVQNPNVINRSAYIYANNAMVSPGNSGGVTADTILKNFFGGDLGIEVVIDGSVYEADENDPNGNAAGTNNYLLPDGQIWIHVDVSRFKGTVIEYSYALSAQKNGLLNPKSGKYMYMIDSTLSGTFEGISQPRYTIGAGWNGIPRMMRPDDLITFNVTATS